METPLSGAIERQIDTGYLRGVLDSTGRLWSDGGPGYITDYWRNVVKTLCDRVEELEATRDKS